MKQTKENYKNIKSLQELSLLSDYSLINTLNIDPDSNESGDEYYPREVFSGHYVIVNPSPIKNPQYISHSKSLFKELGLDNSLAKDEEFVKMFSGNNTNLPELMDKKSWACGYALSIYGTEYYAQCPFGSGNGYGDGRAISIFEGVLNNKRWEMQLKGGGRTPYCRGADGRAVLRSSVREFLAQEHMYALGIPTSRSLSLYVSNEQEVRRPWFSKGSYSKDPDKMIFEKIAITTRVASSFLRVGQIELFARRARKNEHKNAKEELEKLVLHIINREYSNKIDKTLTLEEKILLLAKEFSNRLSLLVSNWIRVGYCQGNFNSDNCAVGGFTLDYGPFGFCELFDPNYQPWTSGGNHFSFFNQPLAAQKNFEMFCKSLKPLLEINTTAYKELELIRDNFSKNIQEKIEKMWASKLGLDSFNDELFDELINLMIQTSVDYTIFFRELSSLPNDIEVLKKSFYQDIKHNKKLEKSWTNWLAKWNSLIDMNTQSLKEKLSTKMKLVNPKYILREWFLVWAYEKANDEDYLLLNEIKDVMNNPYSEQSKEIEEKYYRLKPTEFFDLAGTSHVSCSS
jgi:uncharacterized protein YdiU (UPF0061 family)